MKYTLACKDLDIDCDYVSKGGSIREVMDDSMMHAKSEHEMTSKDLNDPKMMKKMKSAVKKEEEDMDEEW